MKKISLSKLESFLKSQCDALHGARPDAADIETKTVFPNEARPSPIKINNPRLYAGHVFYRGYKGHFYVKIREF